MTYQEKKDKIYDYININFSTILNKYLPLYKRINTNYSRNNYEELILGKVFYPVLEKINSSNKNIDFYYKMVENDKLKNYFFSICYIQIRYPSKSNKRIKEEFFTNGDESTYNEDKYIENILFREGSNINRYEEFILDEIYSIMEPPRARKVFGKDWAIYIKIFNLYMENFPITYRELLNKYKIKGFSYAYRNLWKKIKAELKSKGYLDV